MGGSTKKFFHFRCAFSALVVSLLVASVSVCLIAAASAASAASPASPATPLAPRSEISPDPLGRLPGNPAEADRRLEGRELAWPEQPAGAGVSAGVRVSLPYNTVSGTTTTASGAVQVELHRGAGTIQTVNTTTNSDKIFTADLSTGNITSGDQVHVRDVAGGGTTAIIDCTLTATINTSNDVVSGTGTALGDIDVYIVTPAIYSGDVPPGAARKTAAGTPWSTSFASSLDIRNGDAAFVYATDTNENIIMDVARTTGTLVVYPQYDQVLGYFTPSTLITVHAGSATQGVGSAKDGFYDAWFTGHNIVPGETVSANLATNRSITVADVTAYCDPASNRIYGSGPASKYIRVTMDPYGPSPKTYKAATNASGAFDVSLGTRFTATGTEVFSITWYDADGDCVVYEFQSYSWYLAEGYTGLTPGGGGFDTYVLLQNPGDKDAEATMEFQVETGTVDPVFLTVPAGQRKTVHLDEVVGLQDASVSTKVTCTNGATLNAERSMYFNYSGRTGGHDSVGTMSPSNTWYLAEGYTGLTPGGGGFDTWVLVQNPGKEDASVTMSFQLDKGTAPDLVFILPAEKRISFLLNDQPGLNGVSVSTKVSSDVPVVAERAVYFTYEGKTGGHDSIGVIAPRRTWYLAEGYTGLTPGGGGFDTWVLVQNPGTQTATVTMEFQLDKGTAQDLVFELPGGSRKSYRLNDLPGVSGVSVSTKVTATRDVVVERSEYFLYEGIDGGHNSKAAEEPSTGWYLPEGYTGGTPGGGGFSTWVLVQNPGTTDANVTMKFQVEGGTAADLTFTLPAGTRKSYKLNDLPGLAGVSVSTTVISNVPVVSERAMYFNYNGITDGHDSVGIPFTP